MQSDKSSGSVKRAVSEVPGIDNTSQNKQADQLSTLSLIDPSQGIDAYMASQGEDNALFVPQQSQAIDTTQNMAPAQKLLLVEQGKQKRMEIGETWYLISGFWWKRWRKACTGEKDKEGVITEVELGSIDNSSLVDTNGLLRRDTLEGVNVEYVPQNVWRLFTIWFV